MFKNFRIGKKGQIIFVTGIKEKDKTLYGRNLAAKGLAIKSYRLDDVQPVSDLTAIEKAFRPKGKAVMPTNCHYP